MLFRVKKTWKVPTRLGLFLFIVQCLALGCSAEQTVARGASGQGNSSSGDFGNADLGAAGGSGDFSNGQGTSGGTGTPVSVDLGNGDTCGGDSYVALGKELEIFVLFDNSVSMASGFSAGGGGCYSGYEPECTSGGGSTSLTGGLWQPAVNELKGFINDSGASGVSVGLKYFGEQCDAGFYATPDVAIARLPANAGNLTASLDATRPNSETATRPALEGAVQHVRARLSQPDNDARIVILLVTDGLPDEDDCSNNSTGDVADVAADAFGSSPSIPTYVLGLGAGNLEDLRLIARAGGTSNATLVDATQPGRLTQVMNDVRNQELAALPCDYAMPAEYARYNDPDLVNLTHNGTPVGRVDDISLCDPAKGGWYYDDPRTPSQIHACALTCNSLRSNNAGSVDVTLGCPVVVIPPPE